MNTQIEINGGAQSVASLPPRICSESAVEYYERLGIVKGTLQIIGEMIMQKRKDDEMNKPLQKLVVSKEPTNAKILTAKCECCGDEKEYTRRNWPPDWSQTGTSKYGNAYLKSKIGWWCDKPACFDASRTLNIRS